MKKKLFPALTLGAANGIVYGLNALYYCFIQIYIRMYHPDDAAGLLLAIGPFVAIFAPVFWGMAADRSKSKNRVLALVIAGSAVCYFMLSLGHGFWYLAVVLVLLMFFMSPFGGLVDIITLEYTTEHGTPYGPLRITGTLVFGLLPMVLTGFTDRNIYLIFYVYLVMAALGITAVLLSPKVEGHGTGAKKPSVLPLFRDGKLMLIFLFIGIAQFTWSYYLNFYPGHLTDDLGFSQQVWGINTFVTVLGEIPFFLMFNRAFDKIGMKKLLFGCLALLGLRYAGLAFFTSVPLILAVALITGLATTVLTYCGSVYITKYVEPESKASANLLMYALGSGIPKALSGIFGGRLNAAFGCTTTMIICTAMCAAALVVFLCTFARRSVKV